MPSVKLLRELPKEVMWRVLGFVDESHRAHCAAVARRWSNFGRSRAGNSSMALARRARGSIPNELLVGLVIQFLDESDEGDPLWHIARVWATYLAQSRAAAAAAAVGASSGFGRDGLVSLPLLGMSFGPATEPGPLDKTGRLPNELLESMFDFLDEDMTMSCASVARRWRSSAMELILTSFLSPILWVIPQGAVHNICSNLHATDISQVLGLAQ